MDIPRVTLGTYNGQPVYWPERTIRLAYPLGYPVAAIARAIGCTPGAVNYWVKRLQLERLPLHGPPMPSRRELQRAARRKRAATYAELHARGLTYHEIGARYGVCRQAVHQTLAHFGQGG